MFFTSFPSEISGQVEILRVWYLKDLDMKYPRLKFPRKPGCNGAEDAVRVLPKELGETWASRNAFAFGRTQKGVQRTQVRAPGSKMKGFSPPF